MMEYMSPTFFIIGERKCATSSLYRYLISHPQVLPCAVKEPQFFSKSAMHRLLFLRSYRGLFPRVGAQSARINWFELGTDKTISNTSLEIFRNPDRPCITGEASANTFTQVPPERLKNALPDVRLILCLRHPVDRAYAHYKMLRRFTEEGRRIPFRPTDFSHDFKMDFQRSRGGYFAQVSLYAERLRSWVEVFGWDRMHVVSSEDLIVTDSAQHELNHLCAFLGIDPHNFSEVLGLKENTSGGDTLDPGLRNELMQYYSQDIRDLEEFTGRNFHWS
jgi:hypothetical protein